MTGRTFDGPLLLGMLAYGLVNIVAVALLVAGVVHPPWNTLLFFIFVGPGLGALLLLGGQLSCVPRPFSWAALFLALGALFVASLLNLNLFLDANAAV